MKKRTLISLLGIWVALVPLLGVPTTWKKYILILTGLAIVVIASTRKKKIVLEQVKDESVTINN